MLSQRSSSERFAFSPFERLNFHGRYSRFLGGVNARVLLICSRAVWEHFSHDADMGVRGIGDTKEKAFEEAACALVALTTELSDVAPRERIEIEARAPDEEQLFVEWLDALVFEMATRHMVFVRFEVTIEGGALRGSAWGEKRDPDRHVEGVEVKGATFTELRVAKQVDGRFLAQCVVDV